ncbi:MAG: hypothetical protein HFI70_05165 [Lachnospiraceae bacterium]|nr:hypothetical protein [Lachnospiraceae bacterium]
MTKGEIQIICEKRFVELGAEKIELQPSGKCWTLDGEFFKVTTLQSWWVLEWTDNRSQASNYGFEDVEVMPYNISKAEVLEKVNSLIVKF